MYFDALSAFFFYEFSTDFIYKVEPCELSIGYNNLLSGMYIEAILYNFKILVYLN